MAGFQLTLYGRIWVTPKANSTAGTSRKANKSERSVGFPRRLLPGKNLFASPDDPSA